MTIHLIERGLAVLALILLAPVLAAIGICVMIDTGRPVLFRQTRVGRHGRLFQIFKFRSMITSNTGAQLTAAGDTRVTRAGRLLRKFKLDELPQLWNVANGTMRVVGPRPEVPCYVDAAEPLWREVLSVPPGITDVATLLFRHEETLLTSAADVDAFYRKEILPSKLRLNVQYLRRRTITSDLRIIWITAWCSLFPSHWTDARIRQRFGVPLHERQLHSL